MKVSSILFSVIILLTILLGCRRDESIITPPKPPDNSSNDSIMFIDEPIVLESSDKILSSRINQSEYSIDLSNIEMVKNNRYNDFEISYGTPSSCDENVWIYNYKNAMWDQIGFKRVHEVCLMMPTMQVHFLSSRGFTAKDYVDSTLQMMFRCEWGQPYVRAIRNNPHYSIIPIFQKDISGYSGFTILNNSMWVASPDSQKVYNFSFDGKLIKEIPTPVQYPNGLTTDGKDLFQADGINRIVKLLTDGQMLCQFSVPTDYSGGLALVENKIWLSEYQNASLPLSLFEINLEQSCKINIASVIRTLSFNKKWISGLAYKNPNLILTSDSLYEMTTDGGVIKSIHLPDSIGGDIEWFNGILWVLVNHRTPVETSRLTITRDVFIARYRLR